MRQAQQSGIASGPREACTSFAEARIPLDIPANFRSHFLG
jgi:hypothetical protein